VRPQCGIEKVTKKRARVARGERIYFLADMLVIALSTIRRFGGVLDLPANKNADFS
jgi:hypothetical protein